jgi:hypothetical protein
MIAVAVDDGAQSGFRSVSAPLAGVAHADPFIGGQAPHRSKMP